MAQTSDEVSELTAVAIAYRWDGPVAWAAMPKKSDTTSEQRAALEKRVTAGEWLRTGDAAKVLGISRSKVDLMIRAGELGYRLEPGSRYRQVNPKHIRKLLDAHRTEHRASASPSAEQMSEPHKATLPRTDTQ